MSNTRQHGASSVQRTFLDDASSVRRALVTSISKSSGVPENQVEAVLKTLGLEELSRAVASAAGRNLDVTKLGGLEISARADKS